MKKVNSILLSLLLLATGTAVAQTGNPPAGDKIEPRTVVRSDVGVAPVIPSMFEPIATGGLLDDKLVKNKPLAAVFESETIETLPNGTQTRRRITTWTYRDSDGRTRREQIVALNPTVPIPGEIPRSISVYDPVAGYGYSINQTTRTAHRYRLPAAPPQGAPFNDRIPGNVEILRKDNPQTGAVRKYTLAPPRIEPLGKQQIAGIDAEGRRVTFIVPAGALGNASPIETVYETWMARDLRMLVKSVVRNPSSGEQTLRLITINQTEQPRSLFEVPAGYRITDMGAARTDLTSPRPDTTPRTNAPPPL